MVEKIKTIQDNEIIGRSERMTAMSAKAKKMTWRTTRTLLQPQKLDFNEFEILTPLVEGAQLSALARALTLSRSFHWLELVLFAIWSRGMILMRLVWNVGRFRHPGYLNTSTQQPVLMNLSDFRIH